MTLEETIEFIQKAIDKKEPSTKIQNDLMNLRVPASIIDEAFITVTKVKLINSYFLDAS